MADSKHVRRIWQRVQRQIKRDIKAGLVWQALPDQPPGGRGYQAQGGNFILTCFRWKLDDEEGYKGMVLVTEPMMGVVLLPDEDAKEFYEIAISSLN